MTLPKSVIEEDHRLDAAATKVGEELARLRWHWTLDESNAERVDCAEYGRQVGRSQGTIYTSAKGYETWSSNRDVSIPLAGAIQLAGMSSERAAATEAVAEALGNSVSSTATHRRAEIKEVLSSARDAAVRKNTDVHDEIKRQAETLGKAQGRRRPAGAVCPRSSALRQARAAAVNGVSSPQ